MLDFLQAVSDGVLFGAAGPASTGVVSWLRWEMQAWAGVRPIRFYPGMRSPLAHPEGIDYILLRENSEGLYPGREGDLADLPANSWQTYYTLVRAVAPGKFRLPPVHVEAMYNPALYAVGERGTIEVGVR